VRPWRPINFGERYGVRRAVCCGLNDGGHLAEVGRVKDARADDSKHLRVDLMVVVEAVYDSPRDAQHLARANLGLQALKSALHEAGSEAGTE
jgi:hypothetical protein